MAGLVLPDYGLPGVQSRALVSELMQVMYAAHADGHAQNVAHEFHHTTVGAMAGQREG